MLDAAVSLRSENGSPIGEQRIRLLEAVARERSISAGARAAGLSYKAAWDALDAMANLFGRPLLATRAGGKAGGGAELTETGIRVIQAFRRMEAEMARVVRALEPELAGTGISPINLVSGFLMRTSARNALRGTVIAIEQDAITADVAVEIAPGTVVHALVTNESVRELGLVIGRQAVVLIKAPFVVIAPGSEPPRTSMRNVVNGIVDRCAISAVNAEVVLDIGGGRTIAATITAHSAKAMELAAGKPALALFEAAHVIIAID